MTFRVGQKVVCIQTVTERAAASWSQHKPRYPAVGGVYTIRTLNMWPGRDVCLLTFDELNNAHMVPSLCLIEPGFDARRFRPVVERKTSIEIFTKLLMPSPARSRELCGND